MPEGSSGDQSEPNEEAALVARREAVGRDLAASFLAGLGLVDVVHKDRGEFGTGSERIIPPLGIERHASRAAEMAETMEPWLGEVATIAAAVLREDPLPEDVVRIAYSKAYPNPEQQGPSR